ncbi:hypothetical protein HUT06_00335 [Actinomadura sp. NAK00032]|uniref:hypothetical protein n=1 Tax=Actinomadura sp. NAK00032 TaxID=2742128 RepID=UPI0015902790|nr:hypothetical protein [Actinomadura sp. NAK00032]QKW32673.1 hypothetical protein HUT06_00335 [Actinomadura sp. NAK00032]
MSEYETSRNGVPTPHPSAPVTSGLEDARTPAAFAATALADASAGAGLTDRVFLLDRPAFIEQYPRYLGQSFLDPSHGGLVLCGDGAPARTRELRLAGFTGALVEDPAAYEKQVATKQAPFDLPEDDGLFKIELEDVLQAQIERGADWAVTPSRYIQSGDSPALKALAEQARKITFKNVIVVVAASVGWLNRDFRRQFTAALQSVGHPVALALGGQYNPLRKIADAPEHLRDLLQEVPGVGLWRTDLAAFDMLAYGGSFAAIGAGGSLRHLVPAGEKPESSKPFPHYPSVLVPDLLRFSTADFLADVYADADPPPCECPVCGGMLKLEAFYSLKAPGRAAAHAHNAATWTKWLPEMLAYPRLGDRQAWWRGRCQDAVQSHDEENERIGQPGRLNPPKVVAKWAKLPTRDQPGNFGQRRASHPKGP